MNEKVDVRGAIRFELNGVKLKLVPSFLNLQRIETATGKTVVALFTSAQTGNVSVVEVAKVITHCAEPDVPGAQLPSKWNHIDVGQQMMDEGFPQYVAIVVSLLGAALSPKPAKRADSSEGGAAGES